MPPRVHPQQALAVYVEPLAAGRRVVAFADPAAGLLDRFEALEAEMVVLVGPDDDLDELRGARFDVALVADLGLFDDPEDLLARVRRLVGENGVAVVAAANPDVAPGGTRPFDYYALFDLVAREFADVRMVAQLPFHGVTLAEVGGEDESLAVSVDTQLAEGERAPEAFVAVASQRGASLDPYAIVELPAPPAALAREHDVEHDEEALDSLRAQLVEERTRSQALAARLDATQAMEARAAELERDVAARAQQLAELSMEVEEMRSAAEAGRIAAAQVEELALRADRAERSLAQLQPELGRATETHAAELAAFEQALRERAQAVRELEGEVARREQIVRELVSALEERAHPTTPPPAPPPMEEAPTVTEEGASGNEGVPGAAAVLALAEEENAQLRERLDSLALELARREGDAQATAWTIAELERGASQASRPAPGAVAPTHDLDRRLAAALDELDALRSALSQEHEARVRVESGEELVRARAEIQRLTALLEQLGQKLQGQRPEGQKTEESGSQSEELR
jgi:hypothetical protein